MKANELMLGDWVMIAHGGNATHYAKVTALLLPEGTIECNIDGCCALCKSVKPIPLTPEILEKNGFIRDDLRIKYFTESDDYYDSAIHEITDSIWCFEYQNCEAHFPPCCVLISCIHELQHALRLCGIEKEIEL